MRAIRFLMLVLLAVLALPARAADEADDWKLIGGMLSLMQQFVHQAAQSPDPRAVDKSMDAVLAGENAEANRAAAALMEEFLQDVPPEQRRAFVSIGRDLLTISRRERARAGAGPAPQSSSASVPAAPPSNPPPAR
jgi:ABC-type transporter MlaC component